LVVSPFVKNVKLKLFPLFDRSSLGFDQEQEVEPEEREALCSGRVRQDAGAAGSVIL